MRVLVALKLMILAVMQMPTAIVQVVAQHAAEKPLCRRVTVATRGRCFRHFVYGVMPAIGKLAPLVTGYPLLDDDYFSLLSTIATACCFLLMLAAAHYCLLLIAASSYGLMSLAAACRCGLALAAACCCILLSTVDYCCLFRLAVFAVSCCC